MPPKSSAKSNKETSNSSKTGSRQNSKKVVGYLRVSTGDQELEKNKADILHLANELDLGKVIFVEEKISGKVSWKKRKVADILNELKKGDSIIVSELSRLGRSMLECMEILSVALSQGVNVLPLKGSGHWIIPFNLKLWQWHFRWRRKSNVI